MATWNEIKTEVGAFATKAKRRTEEIADITSMRIRLAALGTKLDNQFNALGKLTYRQLKNDEDMADKISETIIAIDELKDNIKILKEKIELAKKAHAEARARDKEAAVAKEIENCCTKEEYTNKES
jgi:septal ring factor EnvC (AmiA/AmiB activator)